MVTIRKGKSSITAVLSARCDNFNALLKTYTVSTSWLRSGISYLLYKSICSLGLFAIYFTNGISI